jgi:nitrite reductase/ring-hydroxylating ferredoxin subunit
MVGSRRNAGVVLWTGSTSDAPIGALTRVVAVDVPVRRICLANLHGRVFAFEDACPHRRGRLSNGKLVGTAVQCPVHGWRFDVRSGIGPGSRRLIRYPVRALDGELTVYSVRLGRWRMLSGIRGLLFRLFRTRTPGSAPTSGR